MKYFALLLLVSGCASVSTLQTARVLPKDTGRFLVGFGYHESPTIDEQTGKGPQPKVHYPFVEVAARLGVMQNFEAGAKFTIPGYLSVDGKYQLLSQGRLAVAGGLGLGWMPLRAPRLTTATSRDDSLDTSFFDVLVPAYLSYDFTPWLALYLSPKYLFRYANGTAHLAGSSAGVKIGDTGGMYLEASYLKSLTATYFQQWQVNVAFFFGTAQTFPGPAAPPPP